MNKYSEPILEAKELSFSYSKTSSPIFKNLNFKIFAGDMIGLVGINGVGKTTLLKVLSGLEKNFCGKLFFEGTEMKLISNNLLSKKMAIVLTEKRDLPYMTVFDVISQGRFGHTNFFGYLEKSDEKIIYETLDLLGLSQLKDGYFDELSDGQKQKVLLGRAIVQDTDILFLDEPTNYLDVFHKLEILRILRILSQRKKKTILFTAHDWEVLLEMASWIWAFSEDKKLIFGTPEDFILNHTLERIFSHKNFHLEKRTGRFIEKRDYIKKVYFQVEDELRALWLQHALEKLQVEVLFKKEKEDLLLIQITPTSFKLFYKDKLLFESVNIEEVLNYLKVF